MQSPDLISMSISAFVIVFLILTSLAVIMQLIIKLFPYKEKRDDLAVYSAVTSMYTTVFPGTKITKIEEL